MDGCRIVSCGEKLHGPVASLSQPRTADCVTCSRDVTVNELMMV